MKPGLSCILGMAGMEFAITIREVIVETLGCDIGDAWCFVMGCVFGLVLTTIFVILPEVRKDDT